MNATLTDLAASDWSEMDLCSAEPSAAADECATPAAATLVHFDGSDSVSLHQCFQEAADLFSVASADDDTDDVDILSAAAGVVSSMTTFHQQSHSDVALFRLDGARLG